jgi:hypothetical protein
MPIDDQLRHTRISGLILSLALAVGCGDADAPAGLRKKVVELKTIPAAATDAATKTLPGVTLKDAWENVDAEGKFHSYEIRGEDPKTGKIREVRVSREGKVLEVE